jgi:sporulation protein YlmC with PRC-barrel domain
VPADDVSSAPIRGPGSSLDRPESLRIGAVVSARDGDCGELLRLVIDPLAQKLTHLVVAPRHRQGLGRLVPVELVEEGGDDQIRLSCTVAEFHALDEANDVQFLPGDSDPFGYGPNAAIWPYYSIAMSPTGEHHSPILVDRVPLGEVEIRRGDAVHATDGRIGSVQGLVVDPTDRHVTHVLLQEGHLWGRKQVAIPIGAASRVGEEIRVALSKREVEDLPPIELLT